MIQKVYVLPHPPIAIPEIGQGEEKKCQATVNSFRKAASQIASYKPKRIILISPHATLYSDWFNIYSGEKAYGDFSMYNHPEVHMETECDTEFISRLNTHLEECGFPAGTEYDRMSYLDQGAMVPLYYILEQYRDFRLVLLSLSGFSNPKHYAYGKLIREVLDQDDTDTVIIASGDLSHCQKEDGPYGLHPEGPQYDERIMKDLAEGNFENLLHYDPAFLEKAEECGHRSFVIMAGILDETEIEVDCLSHEAPFGVGYGSLAITPLGSDPARSFLSSYEKHEKQRLQEIRDRSDAYVRLARESIRSWLFEHTMIEPSHDLPQEMLTEDAGTFVSLHKDGMLRGCIGTILPTQSNIAREIIQNAVSACTHDPRFSPVTADEFDSLEISVDVLGNPEAAVRENLDVHRYGVICSLEDGRRGLLLPDLDGVDTVDQQIDIACRKGGIDPDDPDLILERFEVVRHV